MFSASWRCIIEAGVAFTSDGRQDEELDVRSGKASAVKRALHQSVVLKRKLSRTAKLSVFKSIEIYCFRYLSHLIDSNPHIYFLSHTLQLLGNLPAYYFLQHNSTNYANRLFLFALKLLHSLVDGRQCRPFRL